MRFLRQNTATRITVGPFLDKTDGITPEVALTATNEHLTFTVDDAGVPTLVIDANATASGGNNDMVHITNDDAGLYDLELTAAQTNYVGRAFLSINYVTDHVPVFHEFMILPANVYDALMGTDKLDVNTAEVNGTAQTAGDLAALVNTVDGVVDAVKLKTDTIPSVTVVTGTVQTDAGNSATSFKTDLASTTNDQWKDALIVFTSGSLAGQVKKITAYNGTTKVVTTGAFTGTPSASDAFVLINK
jgi:hypothetical protein